MDNLFFIILFSTITFSSGGHGISDIATVCAADSNSEAADPTPGADVQEPESSTKNSQEDSNDEEKDFDLELNLASFDKVWETIDATHWDEEKVGQTWDDAKAKYRPLVESATSIKDVRAAMNGLIEELGQSHFGIIPFDSYDVVEERGGKADIGLTFRLTDDGILVSKVRSGSSAEAAGVGTGWVLDKIRDKEISEIADKLKKAAHGPIRVETLTGLTYGRIASGAEGETVELVLRDGEGETRALELEFSKPPGKIAKFGNLPPIFVTSEVRTLEGKIGYFRFNAFFEPRSIMTSFRSMLRDENHAHGIVIDLRGNIGGLAAMTMGMASMFAPEAAELGVMSMRGSELTFRVNENYDPVSCPVAVLVDECSISSAEILAGGLQDLKLARIFGTRTAGLALPSTVIKLPNGDGFQYAFADYKSASGKSLEKDGVVPDEIISLTRDLLLRDSDPVLSQALEWIKKENEQSRD